MHGNRYTPFLTADRRSWVIFDWELYGYCTLPDGSGNLLPLEWNSRASAEAWLRRCYRTWQTWEGSGKGTPPKGWRPRPPESSPWAV